MVKGLDLERVSRMSVGGHKQEHAVPSTLGA